MRSFFTEAFVRVTPFGVLAGFHLSDAADASVPGELRAFYATSVNDDECSGPHWAVWKVSVTWKAHCRQVMPYMIMPV